MPFRSQYLADIGSPSNPYPGSPGPRIANIYKTARRGRITHAFALQLWQMHLQPIHIAAVGNTLPATQPAYDSFVVQTALALQSTLQTANKGGFGIGQKIFNLFMKDLWGHGIVGRATEMLLHAPIDRIVYQKFAGPPASWASWTKVHASGASSQEVHDYLALQHRLRTHLAQLPNPNCFPSVIQLEQFIWHRI